jgi:hypothetical protein
MPAVATIRSGLPASFAISASYSMLNIRVRTVSYQELSSGSVAYRCIGNCSTMQSAATSRTQYHCRAMERAAGERLQPAVASWHLGLIPASCMECP